MQNISYSILILLLVGCSSSVSQSRIEEQPKDFNSYWYSGEAEITSFKLEQARYGDIHNGTAVLVFVTEPFSQRKQVKLDNWRDRSSDNVSVMKLNMTKKFLTGIYPYSMMMSAFTPVSYEQHPKTIKVTTSSQEWCGHTWMQINLDENNYQLKGYSYFESEGDVDLDVKDAILEDELWNRIRLNPESLPRGEVNLLPSTFYLRLRHKNEVAQKANVSLSNINNSEWSNVSHSKYSIEYNDRLLSIYFESTFPHKILGWEETYISGFGNSEMLTTKAKRINTIKSAYWGKNGNEDRAIRKQLGLRTE